MEEKIGDIKIKNRVVVFWAEELYSSSLEKMFRGELNKAPEMEVNVDNKFELENFKSIVAYKK